MASSKTHARGAREKKERAGTNEGLDDAKSALFTRPLGEFTKARDELAKHLKGSGDKEAAARVKAMRRPTVAAWTLNQLARRYPQRMDALLEAGERLREAQRGALEPGGVKELREASQEHRARVNELLRAAPALLEEAGYRAAGANIDRVRDSLLATPTARSEDLERLSRGLVEQEIEPGDLTDVLALMRGHPSAARAPEPKAEEKPKSPREQREEAEPKKAEPKKAEPKKTRKKAAAKPARARAKVEEREAKKKRAAEERDAKKKRAAEERDAKKRRAAERRELAKANDEATRAATEAARKAKEADRLMSAAKKAAEAARAAMDRATSAGEAAEEARARAEETKRRAEELERRFGRVDG